MRVQIALTSCIALLVVGCRTIPIPEPEVIVVPPGFSVEQVRAAVVAALGHQEPAHAEVMRGRRLRPQWYPAGEGPGVIYATYRRKVFVLNIEIYYTAEWIRVGITTSERLRQSDARIHKIVRLWLPEIHQRIAMELGHASIRP